jgi:transposase
MNGVDPYAWAKQTRERIAKCWPNKDIDALMPWNFKPID